MNIQCRLKKWHESKENGMFSFVNFYSETEFLFVFIFFALYFEYYLDRRYFYGEKIFYFKFIYFRIILFPVCLDSYFV